MRKASMRVKVVMGVKMVMRVKVMQMSSPIWQFATTSGDSDDD